jgi:hypothetical protein
MCVVYKSNLKNIQGVVTYKVVRPSNELRLVGIDPVKLLLESLLPTINRVCEWF